MQVGKLGELGKNNNLSEVIENNKWKTLYSGVAITTFQHDELKNAKELFINFNYANEIKVISTDIFSAREYGVGISTTIYGGGKWYSNSSTLDFDKASGTITITYNNGINYTNPNSMNFIAYR